MHYPQEILHQHFTCNAPPFVCGYEAQAVMDDFGAEYEGKKYEHVTPGLYAGFLPVQSASDFF
jgi:hypothetical protein